MFEKSVLSEEETKRLRIFMSDEQREAFDKGDMPPLAQLQLASKHGVIPPDRLQFHLLTPDKSLSKEDAIKKMREEIWNWILKEREAAKKKTNDN